jgi:hypothetical protein
MAPSAVWINDIPSCVLRSAIANPRICARIFSDMANPAASSAALLIRYPDANPWEYLAVWLLFTRMLRHAFTPIKFN